MTSEITTVLVQVIYLLTLGLILALVLRKPLRHYFGASSSYAIWLLAPLLPLVTVLSLFLPRADLPLPRLPLPSLPISADHIAAASDQFEPGNLLLLFWITGALIALTLQCWRQWRFVIGLGLLTKSEGFYVAQTNHIGPVLVGIFGPKIIVPADFSARYTPIEQRLILDHERCHQRRKDSWANGFCTILQCAFWFHPLVHIGAVRFRFDQELACDARIISLHPASRKAYASAMLKTQSFDMTLPLGCAWQSHHFLKERIMNVNNKSPATFQRYIGNALVLGVIALGAGLSWTSQATTTMSTQKIYNVDLTVTASKATPVTATIHVKDGDTFPLAGAEDKKWTGTARISTSTQEQVKFELTVAHDGKVLGHPIVIVRAGEPAKIAMESDDGSKFEVDLKAKRVAE